MNARAVGALVSGLLLCGCGRVGFDPRQNDGPLVDPVLDAGSRDGPAGCVKQLVAAHRGFCALRFDGTAACWGMNVGGQLGTGTSGALAAPVEVPLVGVREVAAGGRHSCFLLDTGAIRCAGSGSAGQLGNGGMASSMSLVDVTVIGPASSVQAGPQHTCALVEGDVTCWGCARYTGAANCGTPDPTPQTRSFGSPALRIDTNFRHTCVLLEDGRVGCFGQNFNGELGGGSNPEPGIVYPAVAGVTDVAVGRGHTCVVSGGTVQCFGYDGDGELGNGTAGSGPTPRQVAGLADVRTIDAGQTYACAVTKSGEVWCWGNDTEGQVGGPDATDKQVPSRVLTPPALQIATSRSTTCALTTDGIQCWGSDADGQLGNGLPLASSRTPVDVSIACP